MAITVTDKTLMVGDDVYQLSNIVRLSNLARSTRGPDDVRFEVAPRNPDKLLLHVIGGVIAGLVLGGVAFAIANAALKPISLTTAHFVSTVVGTPAILGLAVAGAVLSGFQVPKGQREIRTPTYKDQFFLVVEYNSGWTRDLVWSYEREAVDAVKSALQGAIDRPPRDHSLTINIPTNTYISGDQINQQGNHNVGTMYGSPPPPNRSQQQQPGPRPASLPPPPPYPPAPH